MLFYQLTYTSKYRAQLNGLPDKDQALVREKTRVLEFDPRPDGRGKKKLEKQTALYRLRAGNYRIVYSLVDDVVAVLGVGTRQSVYRNLHRFDLAQVPNRIEAPPIEDLLALDDDDDELIDADWDGSETEAAQFIPVDWHQHSSSAGAPTRQPLPRPIDDTFLRKLRIPDSFHPILCACQFAEDVIDADVPENIRERVVDALFEPDIEVLITAPKYRMDSVDTLEYGEEFDQVDMLLQLDPEQNRYVTWSISGNGPALLKGGPGTGKSVVAVYRAAELVRRLRSSGIAQPRILFTTYTRSLAHSCRQLVERLAGTDADAIEVRHFDDLHISLLNQYDSKADIIDDGQCRAFLKRSLEQLGKDRNGAARRAMVERFSLDYLGDEIDDVIIGRGLQSEAEYLAAPRSGRRVRLTADQRSVIWRLHEIRTELLRNKRARTWAQSRAVAAHLVEKHVTQPPYDAVVIDEAQDLQPVALRMLVRLCRSTDRVFVTADSNQSIYGSGFQWSAVHDELRFRGRTSVLRRNYRSTREIGIAATGYLRGHELDDDEEATLEYVHSGPKPAIRYVDSPDAFIPAAMDFIDDARRRNRIGYGGVGILVQRNEYGRDLERLLRQQSIPADFVRGEQIDLQSPRIKIMTLHSAKGLEFPIVVFAGVDKRPTLARELPTADADERSEIQQLNRRLLFVAMTRAMRELLVVLPTDNQDPLLRDIGGPAWTTDHWPPANETRVLPLA